ncbi:MAG: type II secretion system protein GspG [Hyalangium sp.]|uniref:type II secretion system protein GspG n=1 Tax=Hyalangium sp. TaxID=2028555 RepID=UPI00389B1041
MTTTPATSQSPAMAARPSRTGRVVVAVACLLATALAFVVAYVTTDHTLSPNQRRAMERIRRLETVFKDYQRVMGRFPTEQEGFTPLIQAQAVDGVPMDPWGHPYVYQFNNQHTGVISYGADGAPGGQGEDADITSGGIMRVRQ